MGTILETASFNVYDFGARLYDPALGRWLSQDPLAEKYQAHSPYLFCAGNPMRFVDPEGKDVWEIDNEGRIINRIKDKTQDALYIVAQGADGNYQRIFTTTEEGEIVYHSISFSYGTVESQRTIAIDSKDSYDYFKVRGDESGTQLFEFMSQNTSVEWSQAKTGIEGDKGLDFITTSHNQSKEHGMAILFEN